MRGVSTTGRGPSGVSTMVSMASRVVPGSSWTTLRSSPTSRLKRVDLPTLGRPTIAIENSFGASGAGSRSGGSAPITASRRSPLPRPWIAETGIGSPSPSPAKDQASVSRRSSSTLLATTRTGLSLRWRSRATWASSSVIPTAQSRTSRSTSASVMARSACALTARVGVGGGGGGGAGGAAGAGEAPAEERVEAGEDAHGAAGPGGEVGDERLEDAGAVLAGEDPDRGAPFRHRNGRGGTRGAVPGGGGAVDPGEEPALGSVAVDPVPAERLVHVGGEGAGHADAVLVLHEPVVGVGVGQ